MGCVLEDVLIFFSGSVCVPPTGYGRLSNVLFQHFLGKTLATASTCQLTMILPVAHGNNYNKFNQISFFHSKGMMVLVVCNCHQFD